MVIIKSGRYRVGLFLLILGLLSLFGSFILAYLDFTGTWGGRKENLLSVLLEPREGQPISLGIGLRLIHYVAAGVVLTAIGGGLSLSAMRTVPLIEEVTVTLMCPSCKYRWEESMAKSSLESMGYPEVKSLPRRRCAKCGRFIRPRIVSVGGEPKPEAPQKTEAEEKPVRRRPKRKRKPKKE